MLEQEKGLKVLLNKEALEAKEHRLMARTQEIPLQQCTVGGGCFSVEEVVGEQRRPHSAAMARPASSMSENADAVKRPKSVMAQPTYVSDRRTATKRPKSAMTQSTPMYEGETAAKRLQSATAFLISSESDQGTTRKRPQSATAQYTIDKSWSGNIGQH